MSFAATLALIAGYQYGLPWRADADSSIGARMALWGGREIVGLILASLVAGTATTLYAAYHFHRLAPYGVLANLLAMPVVSALVMPMGILGVVVLPFGFDAVFWRMMGYGIDWMIAVVLWVTSLPGSVGRIQAFGTGPLLLGTAGILLLCLLRSPLRWSGRSWRSLPAYGRSRRPAQTCWWRPMVRRRRCGAQAAVCRSCTAAATPSPPRNGLQPMATPARSRMRPCMMAYAATPPAASALCQTAAWCRSLSRWKPLPRTAGAPPWWRARARRRAAVRRC